MSDSTTRNTGDYADRTSNQQSSLLTLPTAVATTDRRPHAYERWLIAKLLRTAGSPPLRFQLWDDEFIEPEDTTAEFTIRLNDPKALLALLTNPNLAFGDLYSAGRLQVDGDLPDLMAG